MKDDRHPYYIEKERKNAEMIPYLIIIFVGLFISMILVGAVKLISAVISFFL